MMNESSIRPRIALASIITVVFWVSVGLVDAVVGPESGATEAVAIIAFLSTAAIWLGMAFPVLFARGDASSAHKTKRRVEDPATHDARLALLIDLMDDQARASIRERLLDDLSDADGEVQLADLLADQDTRLPPRRRQL